MQFPFIEFYSFTIEIQFLLFQNPFLYLCCKCKNNRCCWTNTKYCCTNNLFCKTNACKQTLQAHLWSWKPEICSSVKCSAMLKAEVRPRSWENCWKLSIHFIYFWFVLFCPDPGNFFCFNVDLYCFECAHMGKKSPNAYKYTSLWILIFLNYWETVKQLLSLFLMICCFNLPVILRRRQEWRGRWHDRKLSSSSVFSSLWQRWLL